MRLFGIVLLTAMSFSSFAQVEQTLSFRGQNAETIKVAQNVNVTRPVGREVPDTCTRDVPYESYECNNVTRYRQECSWIPDAQRCWTEHDQVCRDVTRTRQECSEGPSRQECHSIPSREVCVERPTREVCRTDSNGQQHCTTVGGGQSCQTVGGGQSCNTVPGERTCRDVSYTDRDCDSIPRQRCETVPGHNDCRDIPYSEQVCGNVTRYNQEHYACTRTVYDDVTTAKKLTGEIDVRFETNGIVEEFPLSVKVAAANAQFHSFGVTAKLGKEPKSFVILKKKEIKAQEVGNEIKLDGELVFEIVDAKQVTPSFPEKLKSPVLEATELLKVAFEGNLAAKGTTEMVIMTKPLIGKKKVAAEVKSPYPSTRVGVKGSSLEFNLAGIMQRNLTKKNNLTVKLLAPLSVEGELLNAKKPELEKTYSLELKK